jgi:hypothetical protein
MTFSPCERFEFLAELAELAEHVEPAKSSKNESKDKWSGPVNRGQLVMLLLCFTVSIPKKSKRLKST